MIRTHENLHKYIPSEQFRDNIFEKEIYCNNYKQAAKIKTN